jgi:hypothetical protein
MAQTKRKRRTKHRGNAVGMVEVRGRTGRKPTAAEKGSKGGTGKLDAAERRALRLDTPPTWKGAAQRAGIAAAIFVLILLLVLKEKPAAVISFGVLMLALYVPMSYYMDLFIYRRRQAKKAAGKL